MNPQAVAFSPLSRQPTSLNPLAEPFSTGARPSTMLNPAAQSFAPKTRRTSSLNPLTVPFYPAGSESSSALDSETSSSSLTLSLPSSLNPQAIAFFPAVTSFSSNLDPAAPDFTADHVTHTPSATMPDLAAFITETGLTTTEEMVQIKSQTVPTDGMYFEEAGDDAVVTVNITSAPTELSAMEYPMADDADTQNAMPLEPFLYADEAEYNSQKGLVNKYPEIHHFNWLGRGIMAKTSTPAAVSLTVALTPPKGRIADEDNLKDKTILQQAMLAVDPVVYYGDINEIRHLTGESMREAAIGATAVFYTPFGKWVNNSYDEDEERPVEDELDVTRYPEDLSVINGWYQFNDAPTRQNFWDEAEYANKSAVAMRNKAVRERKLYGPGSTRLRNVVTVDGLELTISAKLTPSGDASGLVTLVANAGFDCRDTAPFSAHMLAEKDNSSPGPNQAGDLDDEYGLIAVEKSPSVVVDDDITKSGNRAEDLDGGDESVAFNVAPSAVEEDDLFENPNWADDLDDEEDDTSVAVGGAPSAVLDDGLFKNSSWADDIDDEDDFATASTPPHDIQLPSNSSPTISSQEAQERCNESPVHASVSNIVSTAEPSKSNKPVPNFRPVISGTGSVRFVPVVPIPQQLQVQLESESTEPAPVAPSTELPADAFKPGNWEEFENDEDNLYGPGPANTSSDSSSTDESFNSSSCSSSSSLELFLKPVVADETGALEPRSQEEIDEEDEFLYGPAVEATKPDHSLMPKPLSLPFRPKVAETLPVQMFNLPYRPKPIEVVKEATGVEQHYDNNPPLPLQVMDEQTKPIPQTDSPSGSWEKSSAILSALGHKKPHSPIKMRSVASDHKAVAIPKLDLVPASPAAMLRSAGGKFAEELEEIEEEDEEQDEEEEEPESLTNFETHSEQATAEEDMVNTKVEEAAAMGHVLLKRSPFSENLPALLPTLVEEECDSAPGTPEHGTTEQVLVQSEYQRPTSLTPDAMLRKSVRFAFSDDDQDESSTDERPDERPDELTDSAGIGAIFEDDEADAEDNDSSILSGGVIDKVDPVCVQTSLPARPVDDEDNMVTSSGSGSQVEQVFKASPAGTSVPTTVEEGEEGSPEPDIVPRPAKRPILVAEPVTSGDIPVAIEPAPKRATTTERKSSWAATIKGSFEKKPYEGFTNAAKVQFTPTQRRTSSWTKIENKLHKPKPAAASQEEKKVKKSGLRKALKKVKNAFVKGVKALT